MSTNANYIDELMSAARAAVLREEEEHAAPLRAVLAERGEPMTSEALARATGHPVPKEEECGNDDVLWKLRRRTLGTIEHVMRTRPEVFYAILRNGHYDDLVWTLRSLKEHVDEH